jgi:hypothetical protein
MLVISVAHAGSLKNCPLGAVLDEVDSAIVLALAGFVAAPLPFCVWIVILGEQRPTLMVNAGVVNASFVAGADVTSVALALAASIVRRGFVALTPNGKLPAGSEAVLVIVNVDCCDVCAAEVNETEAGENELVAPAGSPEVVRLAVKFPVLLPRFTVTVYVAE